MSKGDPIHITENEAENLIDSKEQLVRIYRNNEWTGYTINKAHIVKTERDKETELNFKREMLKLSKGNDVVDNNTKVNLLNKAMFGELPRLIS